MTATDELRRLLDERGVKWMPSAWSTNDETFYKVGEVGYLATELSSGKMKICIEGYPTPEQAIAATLGPVITGDTSDGYHTFNELYHHRAVLFSVIVRDHADLAWKSKAHHDGTMYDGMFIVGIETPQGQATYHYDIDPYWDMFECKELDRAPEWDGHTSDEAIERIATLGTGTCRDVADAPQYGDKMTHTDDVPTLHEIVDLAEDFNTAMESDDRAAAKSFFALMEHSTIELHTYLVALDLVRDYWGQLANGGDV